MWFLFLRVNLCVCISVYVVCMCVHARVHTLLCLCKRSTELIWDVVSWAPSTLFLRQVWHWYRARWVGHARWPSEPQRFTYPHLPSPGVISISRHAWLLQKRWFWELNSGNSASKVSTLPPAELSPFPVSNWKQSPLCETSNVWSLFRVLS